MGERWSKKYPRPSWASLVAELGSRVLAYHEGDHLWLIQGTARVINKRTVESMIREGYFEELPRDQYTPRRLRLKA